MNVIPYIFAFTAGGALIWFAKARIQAIVIGGNALAAKLRLEAAALEAKVRGL